MDTENEAMPLRGFITVAELPEAEREWPGLLAYFRELQELPPEQCPGTFLDLVWQYERQAHPG